MFTQLSIEQFFHIIFKRLLLILLVAVLAGTASGLISKFLLDDVYQASSTVIVSSQKTKTELSQLSYSDYSLNIQLVTSYRVICKTERVLNQVINDLDLPITARELIDQVSVTAADNTEIIYIKVKDKDPVRAQSITNTLTRVFQEEVTEIMKMDNVQIINEAALPTEPVEPDRVLNVVVAAVIGLFAGIGLAFLLEYLDRSIQTEEQLFALLEIPVLGSVPRIDRN